MSNYSKILLIVLFACYLTSIYCLPKWFQGKLRNDFLEIKDTSENQNNDESYFTQKLDHFNRDLNTTFQQRYFINDTYWKNIENSPVFICVGGEGIIFILIL